MSLQEIADAIAVDDLDRAIDAGLLRWNGCVSCAIAGGLPPGDVERLHAARESRLSALAARERHRARKQRLQQRRIQREAVRALATGTVSSQSTLPAAAAAALARAKAKAAAAAKP